MFKQTALITFLPETTAQARLQILNQAAGLVSAELSSFAPTVPASHMGGDTVWHLHFPNRQSWKESTASEALDFLENASIVERLDVAAYEPTRFATSRPDLRNGIYRTLFLNVASGTPPQIVFQFENELAGMPDHIHEIANWAMNSTVASRGEVPWTHVWEQEFADIGGLVGSYMTNPYHWSFVDRWFDCEMPCQIVGSWLIRHSASSLERSVISAYKD